MASVQSEDTPGAEQYGDYVVTRQLAVEPNMVVYRARKHHAPATEKSEQYVIVVFRGAHGSPTTEPGAPSPASGLVEDLSLKFLEAVKQQKKARESGARNIVPIHDFGIAPHGAWYATDYYSRGFLKKWITQRAGVTEEELRHIVYSTVQSLRALRQYCQRSHGNLSPSSVLIGGQMGTPLRQAPIYLTYLHPGSEQDADRFEITDLRALGQIIYQLVCRQDFTTFNPDYYPIPASEHWAELGKKGEWWRGLCNRLLDPNLSLQKLNLESLANELQPVSGLLRLVIGVLVVLALLGVAAGVYYWPRTKPTGTTAKPTTNGLGALSGTPSVITRPAQTEIQPPSNIKEPDHSLPIGSNVMVQPQIIPPEVTSTPPPVTPQVPYRPPVLVGIQDQTVRLGTAAVQYRFQVQASDAELGTLWFGSASSNPDYLPESSIKFGGSGTNRVLMIAPVPKQIGETILALSVADSKTNATTSFWFRVVP